MEGRYYLMYAKSHVRIMQKIEQDNKL
uniref:Uncharacterized protein n=1 Tax=Anopheles arabiensis TaxID=7173 RepID=A0A182IHD9_ANOAR